MIEVKMKRFLNRDTYLHERSKSLIITFMSFMRLRIMCILCAKHTATATCIQYTNMQICKE